jgi:hypothetical protein
MWLVVLLPILGPAVTIAMKGRSLWVWGAALIGAYSLFLTAPIMEFLDDRLSEPGDGGGLGFVYIAAWGIGAFVNGVVLLYKAVGTVFHTDGYGP